jgi:choline kinase
LSGKTFLLLDGDLVFEQKVLTALLRPRRTNVLACDGARRLDQEAVRAVGAVDGRVLEIGKGIIAQGKVFGESIGAARIDSNTSRKLFRVAGQLLRNGGSRLYYEAVFQQLMNSHVPFWACNIDGAKWTEIDTKNDLRRAQALFKKSEKLVK